MSQPSLSFIIVTRNRLEFLRITLKHLLEELQPGEEIVVVDGNSTDGSKDYLLQLFDEGKIHQYVSESDFNQAHGWNKAMLMARGQIIKKIMDDDVFCYSTIRKCKDYMLEHKQVDVLISNDVSVALGQKNSISYATRLPQYEQWVSGKVPSFTFGDVHMLIRKSALAYIGLYFPAYVMMDWEYSLRISYLQANIVYYTGYNALNVAHNESITSQRDKKLTTDQGKRGEVFYEYAGDHSHISLWSKIKIFIGNIIYKNQVPSAKTEVNLDDMYAYYYQLLNQINKSHAAEFITKQKPSLKFE